MSALVIRDAHTVVTHPGAETPGHGVDIRIEDGRIAAIEPAGRNAPPEGARVIDASRHVVYPGFVNTHHHFVQTLTRNLPGAQNAKLFDWLTYLYPIWRGLDEEAVALATHLAVGELLLSGCTCTTDHFYLFPERAGPELLDVEIETARRLGMRFHPTRGSMSRGRSQGGLPPDDVVQTADAILRDCARVAQRYHDPSPGSMCRLALAPCSPFSVTPDLLKETAALARDRGLRLHTHLCETKDEEAYCLEHYGCRPLDFMEQCDWLGPDCWYAHGIYFNDAEIERLARTGAAIAHCPASNFRLGSGIAPVPKQRAAGVCVGLGVDGSASNDASNMVREMQLALLAHRVGTGVDAMPPETVLRMATVDAARTLGRDDIGRLAPGMQADLAIFRLDRIDFAGAMEDPAAAILFCGGGIRADYTIVQGRLLVEHGEWLGQDEASLWARSTETTRRLLAQV